jgi:NaMN:DMB phosphoribosyltransferase
MQILQTTIDAIRAPDAALYQAALQRLASQARPQGSLGMIEPVSADLAAIAGTLNVRLANKVIVTCAGDHGVVEEGWPSVHAETSGRRSSTRFAIPARRGHRGGHGHASFGCGHPGVG